MSILTGDKIREAIEDGAIEITDFNSSRLNPNSYNVRLADEFCIYGKEENGELIETQMLDSRIKNNIVRLDMDKIKELNKGMGEENTDGIWLYPGRLYLARTMEKTISNRYVPMLEGRSSVGRLGLFIHVTAGFGDVGFDGYWTLELTCVQPVKIYPGIEIGQVFFHELAMSRDDGYSLIDNGKPVLTYEGGKYQGNNGVQASGLYKDFE